MSSFVELVDRESIERMIPTLVKEVRLRCPENTLMVAVLQGGIFLAVDLLRSGLAMELDTMRLSSYGNGQVPGEVKVLLHPQAPMHGRTVLLVDDICDSGNTLRTARTYMFRRGASHVVCCTMFKRECTVFPDLIHGSNVPQGLFLTGYGLDSKGYGRERVGAGMTGQDWVALTPEARRVAMQWSVDYHGGAYNV